MKEQLVLRVVSRLLLPFILLFGFYIQWHGEYSPGGGFQAGVIVAAGFILYALMYGTAATKRVISVDFLVRMAACGALLYAGVGLVSLPDYRPFLDYEALPGLSGPVAQQVGIMLVETGVGITVFAVMLLLFLLFAERKDHG